VGWIFWTWDLDFWILEGMAAAVVSLVAVAAVAAVAAGWRSMRRGEGWEGRTALQNEGTGPAPCGRMDANTGKRVDVKCARGRDLRSRPCIGNVLHNYVYTYDCALVSGSGGIAVCVACSECGRKGGSQQHCCARRPVGMSALQHIIRPGHNRSCNPGATR
jgi:hypothetical protein